MKTFDFESYFQKLHFATDHLAASYIKQEWFAYYDTLSKDEQAAFKASYNEHLRQQNEKFSQQLSAVKQRMLEAGIAVD